MSVRVLDRSGKPLMPCSEKRVRLLLELCLARARRFVCPRAVQGVSHKHGRVLIRGDGYSYNLVAPFSEIQGDALRRALPSRP
jgi:hypothetical protein